MTPFTGSSNLVRRNVLWHAILTVFSALYSTPLYASIRTGSAWRLKGRCGSLGWCWITSGLGSDASEMGPLIRAWLNDVLDLEQDSKKDVLRDFFFIFLFLFFVFGEPVLDLGDIFLPDADRCHRSSLSLRPAQQHND